MSQDIQFVSEPPAPKRGRYDYDKIAKQLRDNPGEWALLFKAGPVGVVQAIGKGSIPALDKAKGFVTRTANNSREVPRTCDLYLKYDPTLDTTKGA